MITTEVAVLGGGISGLCAAHLVAEKLGGDAVRLLERHETTGGYAQSERIDGYLCDRGPNGFLDKEPLMLEWVEALGLTGDLVQADESSAKRFVIRAGRLVEIVPPPKFILSPILSPMGKARLFCEPLIKAKRDHAEETIWEFAARRIGKEAADTLVSAMVTGVFGGDARKLSLEHCFPRMAQMERDHGGLFRAMLAKKKQGGGGPMGPGGTLTTFREGIGQLTDRAAERIKDSIVPSFEVASIEKNADGYRVKASDGNEVQCSAVISAIPAEEAAPALTTLAPDLSDALGGIEHAPMVVVCTGYSRDQVGHALDGFGFLSPPTERRRTLGCIWTSTIFPHFVPEGHVMLRTMIGGYNDPDAVKLRDDNLMSTVTHEIHTLLDIDGPPSFTKIYRHRSGIPQYLLGHEAVLDAADDAEAANPGFAVAGNAYRGVSLNDCVVSAYRAVDKVLADIGHAANAGD